MSDIIYKIVLVILLFALLSVCLYSYFVKQKNDKLIDANESLTNELSIIKIQVSDMQKQISSYKMSEGVVNDYHDKISSIKDETSEIKEEINKEVSSDENSCNWWDEKVPDNIVSILNAHDIVCRN